MLSLVLEHFFVKDIYLVDSLKKYLNIIFVLEHNCFYLNLNSKCEPQLGKRGLYNMIGSQKYSNLNIESLLWVLNFSDRQNSLLDISLKSGLKFYQIKQAADILQQNFLLKKIKKDIF